MFCWPLIYIYIYIHIYILHFGPPYIDVYIYIYTYIRARDIGDKYRAIYNPIGPR